MSTPSISVIVPVYNTAEFLREALDSVLNQTQKDIEIIAVNDGSTDQSPEILKEYENRITIITKPNEGLAAARNDALKIANGEFIYFMDSDDWIDPDTLERCLTLCRTDDLDLAYFDAVSFGPGADSLSQWQDYRRAASYPGIWKGIDLMQKMLQEGKYRSTACMSLYRRSFLDAAGAAFYPGIIHEDQLFSAIVFFNAQRIEGIPQPFYHRRIREGSIMSVNFSKRNVDGYLTVIRETASHINGDREKLTAYRELVKAIMRSMMDNGWNLPLCQRMRIAGNIFSHPYSFRMKPFARLMVRKYFSILRPSARSN